jgi:hypothetical protein
LTVKVKYAVDVFMAATRVVVEYMDARIRILQVKRAHYAKDRGIGGKVLSDFFNF